MKPPPVEEGELLAESQVLEHQLPAGPKSGMRREESSPQQGDQRPEGVHLHIIAGSLVRADGLLGRDRDQLCWRNCASERQASSRDGQQSDHGAGRSRRLNIPGPVISTALLTRSSLED
jgi:hypothetical protein